MCLLIFLYISHTSLAQTHKDDFFYELGLVSLSSGFHYSDLTSFNIWAKSNKYQELQGNYIPIGVEFIFISPIRLMGGLEFFGQIPNGNKVYPNRNFANLKVGYNLKNSRKLMAGVTLGIGYNSQRIQFDDNPPNYYQNFGLDTEESYLRQRSMTLQPEFHLNYIFASGAPRSVLEGNGSGYFALGLRAGVLFNVARGRWRYGMQAENENGDNFFDSEVIHDAPNIFDNMLFLRINFSYAFF